MARLWIGPLAALLAGSSLTAAAHEAPTNKAEEAIEYRHSVYHVIAWNVTPMKAAVEGKVPYDAATFARHAARVAALTPMLLEGFPPGSNIAGKTHAKEAVWTDRAEFEDFLHKLETRSATLAEVAKSGELAKIRPAFNELVQTCSDCHKKFKHKDED